MTLRPAWFALALIAGNAVAQTVELKFSHFLGPQSFFQQDLVVPWARELEAKTNGRVKVEVLDGSSPFGKVTEQAAQVRAGTVDIALGLRGAEGDRFPGSSIIELPFLVNDAPSGSRMLWSLFRDGSIAAEYRDYKVLALSVHDPGLIHTINRRVVELSDLKGVRLRSPNRGVTAALEHVGAISVPLLPNEVMPAVKDGKIDGIVTNWANPLPGFNDYMKFHTDTKFYVSAFFIVMNPAKYERLAPDARAVLDSMSGEALVARFGNLWEQWARPVREGANAPGHEVIVPDAATMARWREGLRPVADRYLGELSARFPAARAVYQKLQDATRR